jgi:hypothetical protein
MEWNRLVRMLKLAAPALVSDCGTTRYFQGASLVVIPAQAGIHLGPLGSRFRGSDEGARSLSPAPEQTAPRISRNYDAIFALMTP